MARSRLQDLLKRPNNDMPVPAIAVWLDQARSYFQHRGYTKQDVNAVLVNQAGDVDHLIRNIKDQNHLDRLISAIFDEGAVSRVDQHVQSLGRSYRTLAFCFSGLPHIEFQRGRWSLILKGFGSLATGLLAALVCYLVLGALLLGQSDFGLARTSPIIGVLILGTLLTVLAYVEGSHISIARLQSARIPNNYPDKRVVRLHRQVRNTEDADHFYAGRQILVIFIVFFVSRLTSFTTLQNFPFTTIPLPSGPLEAFTTVFIRYGMAGAIFVYWIGQMLPQLVASKSPTWVLKSFSGEVVTRVAKAVGQAGIAAPAEFVARFFGAEPPIPQDARERYFQVSADNGWGYLLQKKEWTFTGKAATFKYEHVVTFLVPGMRAFADVALLILKKLNPTPNVTTTLHRKMDNDGEREEPIIEQELQSEETGEYLQFITQSSPKWGNFEVGDVLSRTTQGGAKFNEVMEDTFQISFPVQHFLFRCTFPENLGISPPILMIARVIDDGMREANEEVQLRIEDGPAGFKAFEYAMTYPPVGTRLTFLWSFHEE